MNLSLVRWFIIVGASLSEQSINVNAHNERGKQYFVQPFLRSMMLLRLHTCFNYTSHWSYEVNFSRLWVLIMHGIAWSKLNYCAWFVLTVSSLPLSVIVRCCHAYINLSNLRSSGFIPTLCSCSSLSRMRQQAGHITCTKLPEDVQSSWNI